MGKINILDEKIFKFIDKFKYQIFIIIISLLALIIRNKFFFIESNDYIMYLKPWVEYMKNNGGILALKDIPSDYNMPYLYILAIISYMKSEPLFYIKIVSVFFDFIAAIGCGMLAVRLLNKENKFFIFSITYAIILFIPTVILNGSAWGQCDIIYTSFLIFSLYYVINNRYSLAFIFFGIAFTFKLQAIFLLPLYVILYFKTKKFSIINFILIPIVNVILYMPAFFVGVKVNKIWNVYIGQMKSVDYGLIFNFPSMYNLLPENGQYLKPLGIIFVLIIIGLITLFWLHTKNHIQELDIIKLAMILIIVLTYFLPAMHDRYMFFADIISIVYFICTKKIVCSIVINFMSLNVYSIYLFGNQIIDLKLCAIIQLVVIVILLKEFYFKKGVLER